MMDAKSLKCVEEALVSLHYITADQLSEATESCKERNTSIQDELHHRGWISQEALSHAYAYYHGMPIKDSLEPIQLPAELLQKIPYSVVKKHSILPIAVEGSVLTIAVSNPLNIAAMTELRFLLPEFTIESVFCKKGALLASMSALYQQQEGEASEHLASMSPSASDTSAHSETEDLLESSDTSPVIKLLNLIMAEAIQQEASDIHFEPFENELHVRYRIDGVLHHRHTPPAEYQSQLLTRLKVLAKLDIAERRLPQDGRIKLQMGGREIDFRVSTVPVINGERIVLRILDRGNVVLGLDQLGMHTEQLALFRDLCRLPEGIVLVTGPTGSGKTTTLYSALSELSSDSVNIMTIEDPVEYKLPGVAQIGVRPKIQLNFATGLRHILRQDPDIILVGEIRDTETAEIAIQAALTGHLVLSTLHTNDAPSAVTRLVDMGIEPFLLSSSVVGILAQRLVRRICPHCRTAYEPSEAERSTYAIPEGQVLYYGKGCSQCFQSGYKGRHGIYELMPMSPKIKRQLSKDADSTQLSAVARQEGMKSLREDGVRLAMQGVTTLEEVLRVSREVC